MTSPLAIVSGCDANYFDLLRSLIASIRDKREGRETPLCIFDAGLEPIQRAWLESIGAKIGKAEFQHSKVTSEVTRLMCARPDIPEYFPGYEAYFWIDADAWVQEWAGVEMYARAARAKQFCVTPEIDRLYNNRELGEIHHGFRELFGPHTAAELKGLAPVNAGVFCGLSGAPHWAAWKTLVLAGLDYARSEKAVFNADQTALSVMMHKSGLELAKLPALYNWLCHTAHPMVTTDGMTLLEPDFPYRPLQIVHATVWTKREIYELETPEGDVVKRTMGYEKRS